MNKQKLTHWLTCCLVLLSTTFYAQNETIDCEGVFVQSAGNQLTISGLAAPNAIAKVFNKDYQLIFECNGDCALLEVIVDLNAGEIYYTDIQFYDENWQFICEDKQSVIIPNNDQSAGGQSNKLVLQPDANQGKDAHFAKSNAGYNGGGGDAISLLNSAWTQSGATFIHRSILAFDLTPIPTNAIVTSAKLSLYAFDGSEAHSNRSGSNSCWLERVTSPWEEATVTWNNQPTTDPSNRVNISETSDPTQNAENIVVTELVQQMVADPANNHGFLLKLQNETIFRRLTFCTSDHPDPSRHPKLAIEYELPASNCESVQITTNHNQIVISNLTAPNEIIKVFDKDFNIVYQCVANCEDTQIAGAFPDGNYVVDLQLYDENWGQICAEQRSIFLEKVVEPCDMTICLGDVVINTQAEIDAFCGCEVIKGNLSLGDRFGDLRDITSLANFRGLKRVEGILSVEQTQIIDFTGLEGLTFVGGGFAVVNNPNLISCQGLEQLQQVNENISILENAALKDVSNFEQLTEVGVQVYIEFNRALTTIEGFSNLKRIGENSTSISVRALSMTGNTQLKSINGFEQLVAVENLLINGNINLENIAGFNDLQEVGTLVISRNNRLRKIDFGDNLRAIQTNLVLEKNSQLENCCVFQHLLDDDPTNGQVFGTINISENFGGCNDREDILQRCDFTTMATCEDIQIETSNDSLIIKGLTAPNPIVKLFDKDYQIIFSCTGGDCKESIFIDNLAGGQLYRTDIQFYDENWKFICEDKQDVEIGGGITCEPVCTGEIRLPDQAAIDAFCGCTEIEGTLIIGEGGISNGIVDPPNDIISLKKIAQLTSITGDLVLINTQLKNLDELVLLSKVGGNLVINQHTQLENITGLSNVLEVGSAFVCERNPLLKTFSGIEQVRQLVAIIIGGEAIENLAAFANIDIANLNALSIVNCESLVDLSGLEGMRKGQITIASNSQLTNLDALQNVNEVIGSLTIALNDNLSNCCAITHLIDDDSSNGTVDGPIDIRDNPAFCSSVEEILANCANTSPFDCESINFTYENNDLTISGLTAPITIVQLFLG